jgi:hypothetical protein
MPIPDAARRCSLARCCRHNRREFVGIDDGEDRVDMLAVGFDHDCHDVASATLASRLGARRSARFLSRKEIYR